MTAAGANRAQARFVTAVGIGSTALLGSVCLSGRMTSGIHLLPVRKTPQAPFQEMQRFPF